MRLHLYGILVNCLGQQSSAQPQTTDSQTSEDSALVAAVLRKDRKATAAFVARCVDDLYGYVRSRLAPRYNEVDDMVQEIFLAAWESLSHYERR